MSKREIVLLIAGLAMRHHEFDALKNLLSEKYNFDVYCFENLFIGEYSSANKNKSIISSISTKSTKTSMEDQALHHWHLLGLEPNIAADEQVTLFGFSMGGMIAATMAALNPQRTKNLILAASSPNLAELPAISKQVYKLWSEAITHQDLIDCCKISFSDHTLEKNPHIFDRYVSYRASGGNQQSMNDFMLQLNSICDFPGREVFSQLREMMKDRISFILGQSDKIFPVVHTQKM